MGLYHYTFVMIEAQKHIVQKRDAVLLCLCCNETNGAPSILSTMNQKEREYYGNNEYNNAD